MDPVPVCRILVGSRHCNSSVLPISSKFQLFRCAAFLPSPACSPVCRRTSSSFQVPDLPLWHLSSKSQVFRCGPFHKPADALFETWISLIFQSLTSAFASWVPLASLSWPVDGLWVSKAVFVLVPFPKFPYFPAVRPMFTGGYVEVHGR